MNFQDMIQNVDPTLKQEAQAEAAAMSTPPGGHDGGNPTPDKAAQITDLMARMQNDLTSVVQDWPNRYGDEARALGLQAYHAAYLTQGAVVGFASQAIAQASGGSQTVADCAQNSLRATTRACVQADGDKRTISAVLWTLFDQMGHALARKL